MTIYKYDYAMILCIIILFFFEGTQEKLSSHDVVLRHWEKLSLSFQQDQRQPKMFKDNRYVDIVIHSVFYLFLKSLFSCHFIVKLMIQLIDWRAAKNGKSGLFFPFLSPPAAAISFLIRIIVSGWGGLNHGSIEMCFSLDDCHCNTQCIRWWCRRRVW